MSECRNTAHISSGVRHHEQNILTLQKKANRQTRMTNWTLPAMAAVLCAVAAYEMQGSGTSASHSTQTIGFAQDAPDGAAAGTSWGKTVPPAVIEAINRQILIEPAQVSSDGRIQVPVFYKKKTYRRSSAHVTTLGLKPSVQICQPKALSQAYNAPCR